MKGHILDFNVQASTGAISGEDGNRYDFPASSWKEAQIPRRGQKVDFKIQDGRASEIYIAVGSASGGSGTASGKNRMTAALLAFFLGAFGIHKFYLGYKNPGIITLLCGAVGILFFLPWFAALILGFVEGVIYLTKSDEEFQEIYVQNKKEWL